jgi:hypothetical protein
LLSIPQRRIVSLCPRASTARPAGELPKLISNVVVPTDKTRFSHCQSLLPSLTSSHVALSTSMPSKFPSLDNAFTSISQFHFRRRPFTKRNERLCDTSLSGLRGVVSNGQRDRINTFSLLPQLSLVFWHAETASSTRLTNKKSSPRALW